MLFSNSHTVIASCCVIGSGSALVMEQQLHEIFLLNGDVLHSGIYHTKSFTVKDLA